MQWPNASACCSSSCDSNKTIAALCTAKELHIALFMNTNRADPLPNEVSDQRRSYHHLKMTTGSVSHAVFASSGARLATAFRTLPGGLTNELGYRPLLQ